MNPKVKTEDYLREIKNHINLLLKIKLSNNFNNLKYIQERINQMIEEVKK